MGVLLELSVQNLLLIEDARLALAPGLNVITGETGAGKTVLASALDLLLGGRARPGIVRPGAAEAYVEGVFELPTGLEHEHLAADAGELILARRIAADGRTRAYLGGRSIGVGELRDLATELLSFYGQHEHRRLMLAAAQLEILDAYCGAQQADRRAACATAWAGVRDARAELDRLGELAGARERELDLLDFELAEIDQLEPSPAERDELAAERGRLRNLEGLRARRGERSRRSPTRRRARSAGSPRQPRASRVGRARPAARHARRALARRSRSRPLTSSASFAATARGSRPSPGASRRSRSASLRSRVSSESTAAASRPCSSTPRAAAPGATS